LLAARGHEKAIYTDATKWRSIGSKTNGFVQDRKFVAIPTALHAGSSDSSGA
jgi:hypothetical protein